MSVNSNKDWLRYLQDASTARRKLRSRIVDLEREREFVYRYPLTTARLQELALECAAENEVLHARATELEREKALRLAPKGTSDPKAPVDAKVGPT